MKSQNYNSYLNKNYYSLLIIFLFFYGVNESLRLVALFAIIILLLSRILTANFAVTYYGLLFFEPILTVPYLEISFFRIYQALFVLRILLDMYSNRRFFFKGNDNFYAASIFLFSSFLYISSIETIFSILINVSITVYFVFFYHEKLEKFYSQVLFGIGIFSISSGIYGFFFSERLIYGSFSRIGAIIGDPNYSAMFYTLGIFSILGTTLIDRKLKIPFLALLIILLLSTVSITGFLGIILLLFIYMMIFRPKKIFIFMFLILLLVIIIFTYNAKIGTAIYGLQSRLLAITNSKDIDSILSNRYSLSVYYLYKFRQLSISSQIFGGNNTISGIFREKSVLEIGNVSHNSYIDMLYMIGMIGTIIMIVMFIKMIIANIKLFKKSRNKVYLSIAFLKITILYYSLSISIFPFRYFYSVFIL